MRIPQTTHVKVSKVVLVLSTLMLVAAIAHWKHFVHHPYHDRLHGDSMDAHRPMVYPRPVGIPQRPVIMDEASVAVDVDGDGAVTQEVDEEVVVVSVEANSGAGAAEAQPARRIDYRGMQLSGDDATPMLGRNGHGQRHARHHRDEEEEERVADVMPPQEEEEPGNTGIVPPQLRRKSKSGSKSGSHSHSGSGSHSPSKDWREEDEEEESGFAAARQSQHKHCRFFKRLARAIRFHLGQAGKPALIAAIVVSVVGVVAGFTGSSCAARAWRFVILGSFFVHLGMLCLRVRDQSFCPALIDHVHKARGAMMGRVTLMMEQQQAQSGANFAEDAERIRQANGAFDEIEADPRGFCMRLVLVADFAIALHHVILLLIAGRLQKVARDAEVAYEMQLQAIVGAAIDAVEMGEQAPLKSVEVVV